MGCFPADAAGGGRLRDKLGIDAKLEFATCTPSRRCIVATLRIDLGDYTWKYHILVRVPLAASRVASSSLLPSSLIEQAAIGIQ